MSVRGKRWLVVPGVALCSLLGGCASQGPLRPPSLNLPAAVRRLAAERVGDSVELSWTTPAKTSDGVALTVRRHGAGALTAEICRSEGALPHTCTPFARVPVTSGAPTTFHDTLPPVLASGPVRGLSYRVRVVNEQGKGAVWTEVVTAAGTAPQPLKALQAYPVASGILLRWQPGEAGVMFRVSRGADTARSTLLRVSEAQAGEGRGISLGSAGGTVDAGGHAGQEQRYVGFRQNAVQLGSTSIVMKSDAVSLVVPATAKLPLPAPPTALEAVVNTLSKPEVDLVWQPPDDVSVTGYRVYRQDGDAPPVLLTPEPIHGFTFADTGAQAGHRYGYRVSAMNPSGESPAAMATAVLP